MTEQLNDPIGKIKILATALQDDAGRTRAPLVFFLGAGASVASGVPLADELAQEVTRRILGDGVSSGLDEVRLESLMETLHATQGDMAYQIVANRIGTFTIPSEGYRHLVDLVSAGFVAAIMTVNFDELPEIAADQADVPVTVAFQNGQFEEVLGFDEPVVAKLHGTAADAASMRGAWTQVQELPSERVTLLRSVMQGRSTVFVGFAGRDHDVRKALLDWKDSARSTRVFWVNRGEDPSPEAIDFLEKFHSVGNYIPMAAEEFFERLRRELLGASQEKGPGSTIDSELARGLSSLVSVEAASPAHLAKQTRIERKVFRNKVNEIIEGTLKSAERTLRKQFEEFQEGPVPVYSGEWPYGGPNKERYTGLFPHQRRGLPHYEHLLLYPSGESSAKLGAVISLYLDDPNWQGQPDEPSWEDGSLKLYGAIYFDPPRADLQGNIEIWQTLSPIEVAWLSPTSLDFVCRWVDEAIGQFKSALPKYYGRALSSS